jgi:glycosyltransferase involved in cell wall biosynthesis
MASESKSVGGRCIATVTNDLVTDQRMQRICDALTEYFDEVLLVGRDSRSPLQTDWSYKTKRLHCRFQKGIIFYAEINLRLWWLLIQKKTATVWAVDLDTLPAAIMARPFNRSQVVYDAHEYFVESPEITNRPFVKKFWSALAHFFIPLANSCVTVGPQLAQLMGNVYKKPFAVIRNVPLPTFGETHTRCISDPPILIYQGALNIGRGLEQTIAALEFLPDVQLWLVGNGDIEYQLQQLAQPYGHRVVFWGRRTPKELVELTKKATIGLNVLENLGLSYYYSLANKAFDYLQAGLPAIHMNFPEYTLFEPAAVLINDLDPKSIANAIVHLLDPDVYSSKSAVAYQLAGQHHWHIEQMLIAPVVRPKNSPYF